MALPILTYRGRWNAVTNTATLVDSTVIPNALQDGNGVTGDAYIIYADTSSVHANIYNRDLGTGEKSWVAQSYIYYDGTEWQLLEDSTGGGGGGTVTSISTTSPIQGGPITTTGNISITQADNTTDGYLSSTDWNTFNSKQAAGNYITGLTGEATASGPGSASTTLSNSAVIGKVLTGYTSGAGVVASTDSILQAIQKLNGNTAALVTGVSSVSGTANRINVSPTTGATVVDIDANYVGQNTITTIGTVTTGTWNATPITVPYGGTGWTYYYITGGDFSTSSTSLVDITGLLTGTLALSTTYEYQVQLDCAVSAVNTGIRVGMNCSVAPTRIGMIIQGASTIGTLTGSTSNVNNSAGPTNMLITNSLTGTVTIHGTITTAGSGSPTLAARALKMTSGTLTIFAAGSYMRVKSIP